MERKPRIGVLALQGAVSPHRAHVEAAGAEFVEVRDEKVLASVDGLILPGGESTTMLKLLKAFDMEDALGDYGRAKPVWGICAGAILAAKTVHHPDQRSFGWIDVDVTRNGYGRQLDSFQAELLGDEVSFIRAPILERVGPDVEVLAAYEGQPVYVRSGHVFLSTFHPELSLRAPSRFHRDFVDEVRLSGLRKPV